MKKIVFTNVTSEYRNCQCCWGIEPAATHTEPGPYTVIVSDHVDPKMAATGFFGNDVVDYQYEIVPFHHDKQSV